MIIKGKSLSKIENNTKYYGCTFYLEGSYPSLYLKNCSFDNCSFRSDLFFDDIDNCTFNNCSFRDVKALFNYKRQVPKEILSLPITSLNMGAHDMGMAMVLRNFLQQLPPEIAQLTFLKELILDGNQLITLPKEIGKLTSLVKLCLSNNQLENIPPEIGNLQNLQYLYLANNKLTSIPQQISKLTSLKHLSISINPISSEEIEKIKTLLPNCCIEYD
ncbi:leucine-rich repeat domain-containing protein [Candidatus Uabimicrobium sp. HlEnr_7]|uniref:leucine-rich repeat domain-containing protein n=1 Tax=Candidatus Uabimicrobium helgolandensis TaxID=3095367 RepID=UPI003558F124